MPASIVCGMLLMSQKYAKNLTCTAIFPIFLPAVFFRRTPSNANGGARHPVMSCSAVEIVSGSSVRLACHNLVGAATGLDDVYLSGSEGQRVGASLAAQSLLVASVRVKT